MNWDPIFYKIFSDSHKNFKCSETTESVWRDGLVSKKKETNGEDVNSPYLFSRSALNLSTENSKRNQGSLVKEASNRQKLITDDEVSSAAKLDKNWPSKTNKSDESYLFSPLAAVENSLNSPLPPLMRPQPSSSSYMHELVSVVNRDDSGLLYRPQFPSMQPQSFSPLYPHWYGMRFPSMVLPLPTSRSPQSPSSPTPIDLATTEDLCEKKQLMRNVLTSPTSPASVNGSDTTSEDVAEAKRRRNNEAAKKSRDARREKEDRIAIKTVVLQLENKRLREEYEMLLEEYQRKRNFLDNMHLR